MPQEIQQNIDVNLSNATPQLNELTKGFTAVGQAAETSSKSVEELKKDVKELTAEINNLSAAEREGKPGQVLADELKAAQVELNAATEATRRLTAATAESGAQMGNVFTKAFSSLRQIAYVLPGIGVAGLLGGIATAIFSAFSKADDKVKEVSADVKEYNKIVADTINTQAKETAQVDILVSRLQSGNTTRKQTTEIIEKLQQIAPDYFAKLDKEHSSVSDITAAYEKYNEQLVKNIEYQIRISEIQDLVKKRLDTSNANPEAAKFIQDLQSQGKSLEEISAIVAKGTQEDIRATAQLVQGNKAVTDEQLKQQLLQSKVPFGVQTIVAELQKEKDLLDQINNATLKNIGITEKKEKTPKEKADHSEENLAALFEKERLRELAEQIKAEETSEEQIRKHYEKVDEIEKTGREKDIDRENAFYEEQKAALMLAGKDITDLENKHREALNTLNKKWDGIDEQEALRAGQRALNAELRLDRTLLNSKTLSYKAKKALLDKEQKDITDFYTKKAKADGVALDEEEGYNQAMADNARARKAIRDKEEQSVVDAANATADVLDGLSTALGESTEAGKDLAIASATIKALATVGNIIYGFTEEFPGPWGLAAGIAAGAATLVGLYNNIHQIEAVQVPGQSGGGGSTPAAPAITYTAPKIPTATSSTNLSAASLSQINQQNSQPMRAYVVESDVTNAQQTVNNYRDASRVGG